METLRLTAWRYLRAFPERQIYIRTDGRVQFFTLSSTLQAVLAGSGLIFLGWVAFTSVNVIFSDRIFTAKEYRFEQLQAAYESRIADLLLSYDELNSALVAAQDRFSTIVDAFDAKQQAIATLIQRKQTLQASLTGRPRIVPASPLLPTQSFGTVSPRTRPGMGGVFETTAPHSNAGLAPPFAPGAEPFGNPTAAPPSNIQPSPVAGQKAAPANDDTGFLHDAAEKLGALFRRKVSANIADHPILKQAAIEEARIARLTTLQPALVAEVAMDMDKQAAGLTRALRNTGIDTSRFLNRVTSRYSSQGGPFVRMDTSDFGSDEGFGAQMVEATTSLDKLSNLITAVRVLPLAAPVDDAWFSSGFGERHDPFNEQLAFHSGIDFSGTRGADVRATAAGVVVFAGSAGAYGNTVEIDHGYGIRTRYGHLAKIAVEAGARLEDGGVVGKLGSTGRSTGPHVHYEVWYDDAVRDPSKFIKAGRYVYEAQGR